MSSLHPDDGTLYVWQDQGVRAASALNAYKRYTPYRKASVNLSLTSEAAFSIHQAHQQ